MFRKDFSDRQRRSFFHVGFGVQKLACLSFAAAHLAIVRHIFVAQKKVQRIKGVFLSGGITEHNQIQKNKFRVPSRFRIDILNRRAHGIAARFHLNGIRRFLIARSGRHGNTRIYDKFVVFAIDSHGKHNRGFLNIHQPEIVREKQNRKKNHRKHVKHGRFPP